MLPSYIDLDPAQPDEPDHELETYLLLLLSDSNLPTGGFVASSGLESFHAHGLLHNVESTHSMTKFGHNAAAVALHSATKSRALAPSQAQLSSATLSFARSTLHSYARTSLPFLIKIHSLVQQYCTDRVQAELSFSKSPKLADDPEANAAAAYHNEQAKAQLDGCLQSISWLDHSYHTLVLNHVARRASKAQGIALLTLYSKAFACPINLSNQLFDGSRLGSKRNDGYTSEDDIQQSEAIRIQVSAELIDHLKLSIRKSAARASSHLNSDDLNGAAVQSTSHHGHFPICWAVFAACMGLSASRAMRLHLFLQARSLLSSSIRLNTLGPYLAHQLMRFQLRTVIDDIVNELQQQGCLETYSQQPLQSQFSTTQQHSRIDSEDVEMGSTYLDDHVPPYSIDQTQLSSSSFSFPIMHRAAPQRISRVAPVQWSTSTIKPVMSAKSEPIPVLDDNELQGWAWDWPEDHVDEYLDTEVPKSSLMAEPPRDRGFWTSFTAPATTFPLGEIIQARHDQLHSRLFNS